MQVCSCMRLEWYPLDKILRCINTLIISSSSITLDSKLAVCRLTIGGLFMGLCQSVQVFCGVDLFLQLNPFTANSCALLTQVPSKNSVEKGLSS